MATAIDYANQSVTAWRRENGRVAVRNHVVILPVDDISNAACEAVANNVKGTMAIPHSYGRLQFGEDLDLHFRTIIGTGANPNVAAVVVIGIEPEWTQVIVDGIAKTGKPVEGFSIEQKGDFETIRQASWKAKEFVHWATEQQKEECGLSELWVSTKCGESDTTTGLSSCPTVGNMYDKLLPHGLYGCFGEEADEQTAAWERTGIFTGELAMTISLNRIPTPSGLVHFRGLDTPYISSTGDIWCVCEIKRLSAEDYAENARQLGGTLVAIPYDALA